MSSQQTLVKEREYPGFKLELSPDRSSHFENLFCITPPEERIHDTIHLVPAHVFLGNLGKSIGDVTEEEWDEVVDGYSTIYLMGAYQPTEYARNDALRYKSNYQRYLPDIEDDDIVGSVFAHKSFELDPHVAKGWEEIDKAREYLNSRGVKLILDYIPNHIGIDDEFLEEHPEYFIDLCSERVINVIGEGRAWEIYQNKPGHFYEFRDSSGMLHRFAKAKDPNNYECAWSDCLQIDYSNPKAREFMASKLTEILEHTDGVRIDMPMLVNHDLFKLMWGYILGDNFNSFYTWGEVDEKLRENGMDDKLFIFESYEIVRGNGFSNIEPIRYAFSDFPNVKFYMKEEMYDLLKKIIKHEDGANLEWLRAFIQNISDVEWFRQLRFTGNHDEVRALNGFDGPSQAFVAEAAIQLLPGSAMVNYGDYKGFSIRPDIQISRWPEESINEALAAAHRNLLRLKNSRVIQGGDFRMHHRASTSPDQSDTGWLDILTYEYVSDYGGVIINMNFSDGKRACSVFVPPDVEEVSQFDLIDGEELKTEVLGINTEDATAIKVNLLPYSVQALFYFIN